MTVSALCLVMSISGLVVEYIVAIDVTRVRFPADARFLCVASVISDGQGETQKLTHLHTVSVTVAILAQGTPRGDAFYAALLFLTARVRTPQTGILEFEKHPPWGSNPRPSG